MCAVLTVGPSRLGLISDERLLSASSRNAESKKPGKIDMSNPISSYSGSLAHHYLLF